MRRGGARPIRLPPPRQQRAASAGNIRRAAQLLGPGRASLGGVGGSSQETKCGTAPDIAPHPEAHTPHRSHTAHAHTTTHTCSMCSSTKAHHTLHHHTSHTPHHCTHLLDVKLHKGVQVGGGAPRARQHLPVRGGAVAGCRLHRRTHRRGAGRQWASWWARGVGGALCRLPLRWPLTIPPRPRPHTP